MSNEKSNHPRNISINDAVEKVLVDMTDEMKMKISNSPRGSLLIFHQSLGQYIRNKLHLWDCYRENKCSGLDPEWTSYFILEALWDKLQTKNNYRDTLRDPESEKPLPEELRYCDITHYWKAVHY